MSTEGPEVSSTIRDLAEKSVEQARGAVSTLLQAAQKASETIQSTTKTAELPQGQAVARGFGYAQENISSIFDFAQKLVRAPGLTSEPAGHDRLLAALRQRAAEGSDGDRALLETAADALAEEAARRAGAAKSLYADAACKEASRWTIQCCAPASPTTWCFASTRSAISWS